MKTEEIQQVVKRLQQMGYYAEPKKVDIAIPEAGKHLADGLRYFLGSNARWHKDYERIVSWLSNNHGKGLLVLGNPGTGKSLICERILPILLYHYRQQLILKPFRAEDLNTRTTDVLASYALYIDDIGTEGIRNNYGEKSLVLPDLVDRAEKYGKLLVMTTNLKQQELLEKYGGRTIDRLRAITEIVTFTGKSFR